MFFGGFPEHQFEDLSGITGLDDPGDGRSFALLDYDRDGWLDVALGGPGAPRLRLLRNGMGDRARSGFVALRFVGGNKTPAPSKEWSARDGFGTAVELDLGEGDRIYREQQPESGYLAQHSSTMIVGIWRPRCCSVRSSSVALRQEPGVERDPRRHAGHRL